MVLEKIHQDLEQAVRQKDQDGKRTLRYLLAAIHNLEIALLLAPQGKKITDEQVIEVINRLIKTHKESIEAFKAGGREDLVKKEEKELAILKKYLEVLNG